MPKWLFPLLLVVLILVMPARAAGSRAWEVASPNQGQTFAYGSERHRQWITEGNHLGIVMNFTNEPYVDGTEPRRYDDFLFNFPGVRLGKDGHTFYYHPAGAHPVAVAVRHSGFLGTEVRLLPSSLLVVRKLHGLVSLDLIVTDSPLVTASD